MRHRHIDNQSQRKWQRFHEHIHVIVQSQQLRKSFSFECYEMIKNNENVIEKYTNIAIVLWSHEGNQNSIWSFESTGSIFNGFKVWASKRGCFVQHFGFVVIATPFYFTANHRNANHQNANHWNSNHQNLNHWNVHSLMSISHSQT